MHDTVRLSTHRRLAFVLAIAFGLAACGGTTAPTTTPGAGATSTPGETAAGGGASTPGEATVEGSLVSSGAYDATWTWQPGNAAGPGIGGITLNSDKGTFGNIEVLADGSISFSSGAPELSAAVPFSGSGAQVRLTNGIPCGFTLDNDLTGSGGSVLHLKGTLTIHGGAFEC